MAEPVALVALALDAALGWPDWLYRRIGHPVGGFARLIAWCERRWNRPAWPEAHRRLAGVATLALLLIAGGGAGWAAQWAAVAAFGAAGYVLVALMAFPALAQRSLHGHVLAVAQALAAHDLPAARQAVGRIVGRDTEALTREGVIRAAVETVAENASDGVIAPLFYMMLGGAPLALTYKAVNTMDSMVGYKTERYLHFGRAAAKLDDAANYLPSRIAALLWVAAAALTGNDAKGAWRIWRRDRRNHASPNSAQTESACAGALGVQLAVPATYFGQYYDKPTIGDATRPIEPEDILRANRMMRVAGVLGLMAAAGIRWILG